MIELKIDSTKNELSLTHDMCCDEHLAGELAIIIDIIVADYFMKFGHKYDNCSLEEKEKIIIEKRKEILQLISDKPCTCKDYLKNSDIHIIKKREGIFVNCHGHDTRVRIVENYNIRCTAHIRIKD